ncbi:MAG: hypothetical protein HQL19_01065 [Candidatus Omnitrophica bacterium]|nr:hypothetical protein [Candidatus Omnitrophota bacterium]
MALRSISLILLIIWISGCASARSSGIRASEESKARTFAEIYRRSKNAEKSEPERKMLLSLDVPIGVVKPYLPVILPPKVIKIWVPSHIQNEDRDIMVGGHWSFVMLDKTRWFIEGESR